MALGEKVIIEKQQGEASRLPMRLSINSLTTLLILSLAIPLNLLIVWAVWRSSLIAEDAQRKSLQYASELVANAVDAEVGKFVALSRVMGATSLLLDDDIAPFEKHARTFFWPNTDIPALVSDMEGRQLVNLARAPGQSALWRSAGAMEAQKRAIASGGPVVSDVFVGASSGKWIATVERPILRNGRPFRVLSLTMSLSTFRKMLDNQKMPPDWLAAIVDRKGNIVARVTDNERYVGSPASEAARRTLDREGVFETVSLEGYPIISANARSESSGWMVITAVKKTELQRAAWASISESALIGMGLSVASLFLAAAIARRIRRPIGHLKSSAALLMAGQAVAFDSHLPEIRSVWKTLRKAADERDRSLQALRESRKQLAIFVAQAPVAIAMFDRRMVYLAASRRWLDEYDLQDPVGRSHYEMFPNLPERWKDLHRQGLSGAFLSEENDFWPHADGRPRWLRWAIHPWTDQDGSVGGIIISTLDVTAQQLAEATLRANEEKFRTAFANAAIGFALLTPDSRFVDANANYCRLVGYSVDELRQLASPQLRLVHPEDVEDNQRMMDALRAGAIRDFVIENRYVPRDGGELWVRKSFSSVPDDSGALKFIAVLIEDISERLTYERSLSQSEARLRAVLDGLKDAVVSIDERGIIQSINAAGDRLFGYERQDLLGRNVRILMPEPDKSSHDSYLRHFLATGEAKIIGIGREVQGARKDGSLVPIDLSVVETRYSEQRLFVGIIRDLSYRSAYEARVEELQAGRMDSIGGMAGSIAHELNQPLTAATAYLATALRELRQDAPKSTVEEAVGRAVEQNLRAGQIISNLRGFVSRTEPNKTIDSLHRLIRDVVVQSDTITTDLRASDDETLMDTLQISQVLTNLMRNAEEAMGGAKGARIEIATRTTNDGFVEVAVADNGPGGSPEVAATLFEPFRTTKSTGMGIGLSICRSIVELHYGRLWTEPNPGGGAIFKFTLPLADAEIEE